MSYSNVCNILGAMICGFGLTQILPFLVSVWYNDGTRLTSFLSILCTCTIGILLMVACRSEKHKNVQPKEAMLLVSLAWFSLSLLGSIPFMLAVNIPFVDAFFESVSALTTTGASAIADIESLPYSILFWRSFMQWIGGMGVVVFSIAVMPFLGKNTLQVFHAEVTGVITDKVKPKLKDTALFLLKGYCLLTICCFIMLLIAGMDTFDAITHTFTTVATGGFSTKNDSAASFSPLIQWILMFFMFASGVNFALLFFSTRKVGMQRLWKDPEYRWYIGIIILVSIATILVLLMYNVMQIDSLEAIIRISLFQVISLVTTTGFVVVDYSIWPAFILVLFLFITFVGGCGGSTSGGFKVIRMIIITKLSHVGFIKRLHPNSVQAVKVNDFVISENIFLAVSLFFILYIIVLFLGTCCVSLFELDLITSFTAVLTSLTNVGPGLGAIGPVENFAGLPTFVKYILSFLMIVGRLELYTVLILFLPLFWRI